MPEIKVAFAGVGNVTSALIQALRYYRDSPEKPGLIHPILGGYRLSDIRPVAAFDVDENKVGKDLSEAIFVPPTNTPKWIEVPKLGVDVMMGPVMDGLGRNLKEMIKASDRRPVEIGDVLRQTGAEMLLNFLPTGSSRAVRYYADQAIKEAEVGFLNGIPEPIVSGDEYPKEAEKHGVPLVGDDVKSQVGGTILHRTLAKLFMDRGVRIRKTYQFNTAGHTDMYNLIERPESKHKTKTAGVTSIIPYEVSFYPGLLYVGFLEDTKICNIYMEGEALNGAPMKIEAKLQVFDGGNAAACMLDAIRCCKLAKDRGVSGPLISTSAYYMKNPPKQIPEDEARRMLEEFIEGKRER